MAKITKYFQVTNQILLSYEYDKAKVGTSAANLAENSLTRHHLALIQTLDGNTMLIDNYNDDSETGYVYNNNDLWTQRFPDKDDSNYVYPGYFMGEHHNNLKSDEMVAQTLRSMVDRGVIKTVYDTGSPYDQGLFYTQGSLMFDSLKLHLVAGYTLNNISALCVKVKVKQRKSAVTPGGRVSERYVTLLNYVLFKERLSTSFQWTPNVTYMNSKCYDRYIEIKLPNVYSIIAERLALQSGDIEEYDLPPQSVQSLVSKLDISPDTDIYIEFSVVENENITKLESSAVYNEALDNHIGGICRFYTSEPLTATITMNSNSDLFNVRMYRDPQTDSIVYYPVWGDDSNATDLNVGVMNNINTGRIQLVTNSFIDQNSNDYEEFVENYGLDAMTWCVLNELTVTYEYRAITGSLYDTIDDRITTYTEILSRTIDYTNRSDGDGQFWRTSWKPVIQKRSGKVCTTILMNYTCHLINRLNGAEIIRSASMRVGSTEDESAYAESIYGESPKKIDVSNLTTWKVMNKYEKVENVMNVTNGQAPVEKHVRTYVSTNNIVVQGGSDSQTAYRQGQFTLRLYRTDSSYILKLYQYNPNNNIRTPYEIRGEYKYQVIFPTEDGDITIEAKAPDAEFFGPNALMFTLKSFDTKRIMALSEGDRWFSVMTAGESENTTLYQGKTDWI